MENPLVIHPKAWALVIHNPLQLFRPLMWFSWLIRVVTGSKWNHSAILFQDADKQLYIAESNRKGTNMLPFNTWLKREAGKRTIGINIKLVFKRPDKIKSLLGLSYGTLSIIKYFFWLICKRVFGSESKYTKWFDNEGIDDRYFCSEYVAECAGFVKPWKYSPKDIGKLEGLIEFNNDEEFVNFIQH